MNSVNQTLRLHLGQQIREYLRRGSVRQLELAQKLGISGSAVSQIIHGRIVPSSSQLKKLSDMLNLNRSERCELSSLLARIRVNDELLRSPFNNLLMELRMQRHWERRELAERAGLPETKLLALENLFDAVPTADEINRLAAALQVESSMLAAGIRSEAQENRNRVYAEGKASLISVAEPLEKYSRKQNMPEILLSHIGNDFDGSDISLYAATHSHLVVERPFPPEWQHPVQISAIGRDLSLPCSARIEIVTANERPADCGSLDLCRTGKGSFFIVDSLRGRDKVLRFCGTEKLIGRIVWRLPVIELVFRPVFRAEGGDRDEK